MGARERFVPAASVGRREEERQRTVCRELRGGCVELRGCLYEQEQHRRVQVRSGSTQSRRRTRVVPLPSVQVTAELGGSGKEPWATSGRESANEIAARPRRSQALRKEGTSGRLGSSALSAVRGAGAEAAAPSGFSERTSTRSCIYGSSSECRAEQGTKHKAGTNGGGARRRPTGPRRALPLEAGESPCVAPLLPAGLHRVVLRWGQSGCCCSAMALAL